MNKYGVRRALFRRVNRTTRGKYGIRYTRFDGYTGYTHLTRAPTGRLIIVDIVARTYGGVLYFRRVRPPVSPVVVVRAHNTGSFARVPQFVV